jgi:hypothetical protein
MEATYLVMVTGHRVAVRGKRFCDTFTHGIPVRIKRRASAAKAGAVRLPDHGRFALAVDHVNANTMRILGTA